MKLVTAILLLQFLSATKSQEIKSTGQHSSGEFLWAVDSDNLSFNITFSGIAAINYLSFTLDWSHVSTDGVILVSFRTQIASSGLDQVRCYYGTDRNNPPYASVNGIDYNINCDIVGSTLESQFTIVSPLTSSYNKSRVQVVQNTNFMDTDDLTFKYCAKLEGDEHLEISGETNAKYGTRANYTCSSSALVVNNTYDENINTYSRTCNYDAEWSDQGSEVDCWFAPEVNITITQDDVISNGILISEDAGTLNCTILANGNPVESLATYFKNGVQISNTFAVTSGDNGARIFCQMSNSYVNDFDTSAGISRSIILDVLFQPEPLNGDPSQKQYARIGEDYTMIITFNANPWIYISNTALYFDGELLNTSNASISYSGTRHEYRYSIAHVSEESFGTYILSTRSPSAALAERVTNFTVVLNSTKLVSATEIPDSISSTRGCPTEEYQSIAAAAAISACIGLVVGVAVSSAFWWWLRRSRKEPMNDDKMDPPYEPTYVEPDYSVINQETADGEAERVTSQEQTNVNAAYEVIR